MEIQKTKETLKKVILIIITIFLISFVSADLSDSIPAIPDHFYGNVLIDNQNAPVGTQIEVYVDSVLESTYNVTEVGKYDLYVKTGGINYPIDFKIQDKSAGTSTRKGGETIYLNLDITTTASSPDSSSSSSSGGGGGGGSGGGGGFISSSPTIINESVPESEENKTKSQENLGQGKTSTGITGSTILDFVKSGKGIGIILVIMVIVIGGILIKSKALRKWKGN